MKLLLVEDQKSDLLSVQRALAQVPNIAFELKNVETIAKAQAILTEEDFDAVLVDVHLPDGTALEIIQHVRTMPTHTPVIVFTGDERRATDLAVMEAGADDFLLKSDLRPELLDRSVRYAVERSRLLRDMKYKARYDSLTCIPNREYFNEFLQHAVSRAHRDDDRLAVLYVDLDRFKEVNDELGHTAGDTLLMSVAERTLSCVRSGDLVARLAGDEFAICLNNIRHPEDAARVAAKLIDVLRNPHTLGAHRVSASPSVGIATYPEVGGSVDGLMSAADTAMYAAKRAGGATFRYFSQDMQDKALARHRMEHDLGAALGLDQFELFAQPQVNAASRQLVGLETLLRWRRDPRELVLPGDFIPLAEETGLIVPIGAWTLRASCLLVRRWAASGVLPEDFSVAVNVSARELLAGRLLRDIERALDDAAVAPAQLELEVTESAMMDDPDQAIGLLTRLHDMGLRIAIDDFGTGYSSLGRLTNMPIDVLKIDKSFIANIGLKAADDLVVTSTINLAHNLGLEVVAEGVETKAQRDFLQEQGCDRLQGYLFGRPLPAVDFTAHLRTAA